MPLIIIDGLDGSGKSTQALNLAASFNSQKKTVCLRIHPSDDNWFGKQAKKFLYENGKSAHFASALFYMFDVLRSIAIYSWRKVDYVIFVRYLMGTAYLPSPLHCVAYNFFALIVPKSENMFFLDIKPKEAVKRMKKRSNLEMFENIASLTKVRSKAIELTRFSNWIIFSAEKPAAKITAALEKKIN